MTRCVSLIDSGLRRGSENLAIDRAWLALAGKGEKPGLLRFYRSSPHASIGRHQAIDRELRMHYCTRNGIEMLRRISGGGALYVDQHQLGFSLILPHADELAMGLQDFMQQACEAVALGLQRFGLEARYHFPNDLETGGRKIASVFAAIERNAVLLHGSILFDADTRSMLEALRIPTEKLSPGGLAAARDRLATLSELCQPAPHFDAVRTALAHSFADTFQFCVQPAAAREVECVLRLEDLRWERRNSRRIDWSDSGNEWLEALWKSTGGLLRVRAELANPFIANIEFSADCHAAPASTLQALADALAGLAIARAADAAAEFFRQHPADMSGLNAADFTVLLELLRDKYTACHTLGLSTQEAGRLMAHPAGHDGITGLLQRSTVMLVPYCAKPNWCKWRHQDNCAECGRCEAGEAYRLGRERGMRVTTITRYEHLVETLADMKAEGVSAYVGMCCSNFFIKRHHAFQEAGIPGVLMDISGANCYELQQEDQAYAGTFQAEAQLDGPLLQKVMRFVPGASRHAHDNRPSSPAADTEAIVFEIGSILNTP